MPKIIGNGQFCGSLVLASGVAQCVELNTNCGCSQNRVMRILSAVISVDPESIDYAAAPQTSLRATLGPECDDFGVGCNDQLAAWNGYVSSSGAAGSLDLSMRLLGCDDNLVVSEMTKLGVKTVGDASINASYRVCYQLLEVTDAEFFKVSTTGRF